MGRHAHSNNYNYIEYYHCITCIEKTLGGLYIENGVLYDRQSLGPRRSSVGCISILFTRPPGKRTTCDCRQCEGDPSVQLYSGSVLVTHIDGTFSQRSCDAQY